MNTADPAPESITTNYRGGIMKPQTCRKCLTTTTDYETERPRPGFALHTHRDESLCAERKRTRKDRAPR